jgi:hypothetical protein
VPARVGNRRPGRFSDVSECRRRISPNIGRGIRQCTDQQRYGRPADGLQCCDDPSLDRWFRASKRVFERQNECGIRVLFLRIQSDEADRAHQYRRNYELSPPQSADSVLHGIPHVLRVADGPVGSMGGSRSDCWAFLLWPTEISVGFQCGGSSCIYQAHPLSVVFLIGRWHTQAHRESPYSRDRPLTTFPFTEL